MSLEQSEGNSTFTTDTEKLQLLLFNLLGNAIEYSEEEGIVEVRAWRDEDQLSISVTDSGIGMDESEKSIIFDRFTQVDTGVTKTHLGHGLGLSVTKAAADLMEGHISLDSQKGEGSVFTVSIPEAESATGEDISSFDGNEFIFNEAEEF